MVMAPLTRFRADEYHIQLPILPKYYAQRTSVPGTLIISEATFISKRARGYPNVTTAVHQKGSDIFLQLWALGRVSMPETAEQEGFEIVSSNQEFVADYAQAARNAMEAGFDGVEIHGAGGYLVDRFTQDKCNTGTEEYGGSVENRSQFLLEVVSAVVNAVGSNKVRIRLSPWQRYQGMRMDDPLLKRLGLAYLHLVEVRVCGNDDSTDNELIDPFFEAWGDSVPVILASGFKPDSAKSVVNEHFKNRNVLVAFGRYFISNPDLAFRIQWGLTLTLYDRSTFYMPLATKGYADYVFSEDFETALL
ncbi:FMN-linked oxidoreductase [Aspergillus bertholletiae]|uniref:FMN-linked oxidoreductase n=1 Tax=Aspergillus bertholletiae TaxID=1226010 RepID=A0A5N7BAM8_9EURO|nr:FMN-linked oxidoreductase [Aspergillus bertholletiae]